ncbi:MAG: tRNA (N6-threonylcarbamoyladenosine(37)-N6)-methyltransferase TrmO [Bacteroidales bacterium]|nr:tRNA (N6-threonylcarbamoyladenosine(37)-N6)-methyltransferase TrmO [Bacteroidales bacterium]
MINLKPIGFFYTDFTFETGAPRQGRLMPESKGIIVLDEKYTEALRDLDKFEYIYVLFYFHKITEWESIVTTRRSKKQYGLFATRTPRRPNPIGMTLIKLDAIKENKLYVSGVDAYNQTPVLDIKPFLPDLDFVKTEKNRKAENQLRNLDKKE